MCEVGAGASLVIQTLLLASPLMADIFTHNSRNDLVQSCSGTLKAHQSQTGKLLSFMESSLNTRLASRYQVRLWAEGNCCWHLHSRRRFKGATLELSHSAGPVVVGGGRVRSVSRLDCYTGLAGGSLLGLLAGGLLALLAVGGLLLHSRYKRYNRANQSDTDSI